MFKMQWTISVVALTLLLAGGPGAAKAEVDLKKLKRSRPVSCTGAGTVKVVGKLIETNGAAVTLTGACTVIIKGSALRSTREALVLTGSGSVVIEDSEIKGEEAAIAIRGTVTVKVKGSVVTGKVVNVGTGSLVDLGGNLFDGKPGMGSAQEPGKTDRPEAPAAPDSAEEPGDSAAPASGEAGLVCQDNQELTLKGRVIKARGVGILARGNCNLILDGGTIEAGEVGLQLEENAEVTLRKCVVKGGKNAATISGNATLHAADTVLHGKVKLEGNGEFDKQARTVVK